MKLHGRNRLQTLYGLDDQTDKWLRGWIAELTHANWKQAKDVLRQFPQAIPIAENIFQFRVGIRTDRIEVVMSFSSAVAVVTELKQL